MPEPEREVVLLEEVVNLDRGLVRHYRTQPAKSTVKIPETRLVASPEPEKTKEHTSRPTPDSESDDHKLHASSEELDLDSNSGTNSVSKTLNVAQDVHAPTAALKVPIIPSKYQDAKYKIDLGSDPIQTIQRCTSRSTRSIHIPHDFVQKISKINYGVSRPRPCTYWNLNRCKLCFVRLGAALFNTLID